MSTQSHKTFAKPAQPLPAFSGRATSSDDVIAKLRAELCALELTELRSQYPVVYYFDPNATRTCPDPAQVDSNFGYDDQEHHYVSYRHDHIAWRYEVLGPLGAGSFGHVFRAHDHKSGKDVAIKVCATLLTFIASNN